jgi:putative membrane protein
MWRMNWAGWIFWILLIVILIVVFRRLAPSRGSDPSQPTALEILDRRYASGEISTEEYEERKSRLTGQAH